LKKKKLSLGVALLPIFILVLLLSYNVLIYGDDALGGSNQFILLLGGAFAGIVGFFYNVSYDTMLEKIAVNLKSVTGALLILLFVGALAGTWLISGIIPAMIYYGLQILHPSIFLPACIIICSIISLATGSSWTTSATVGIALIGIGKVLGVPEGMIAGAVISGAYFGDKLSPLSDTTNLAPAMAGGELFSHIRYMTLTTIPSILITLIVFLILSLTQETTGETNTLALMAAIKDKFTINGWLFLVPATVILLIVKKSPPLIALLVGTLMGGIFALLFQSNILLEITKSRVLTTEVAYRAIMDAISVSTEITTSNALLNDLFTSGGMEGMLGTIWLIICAMVFGGIMDAIGALESISNALLNWAQTTFQLFASTVVSCLAINLTASDQYLSIVIPGKMFAKAYKDRKLAPENLSRTLEDSGTVTSVLIPWNTCGAYQSGVLGVGVGEYFIYAVFNWISPFMTLLYAAFDIKIKALKEK
jgi:NhaC family Na+:H+ antiporter|tara:strand:+ start:1232 stop:2665 length:1434 start_codon:yes stop_codon:yes gene_type:complete